METGEWVATLRESGPVIRDLCFDPQGEVLVAAQEMTNSGAKVLAWSTATGEQVRDIPMEQPVLFVDYPRDGSQLAVAHFGLSILDPVSFSLRETVNELTDWYRAEGRPSYESPVNQVVFDPQGKKLVTFWGKAHWWDARRNVTIRDAKTLDVILTIEPDFDVNCACWSPDGKLLALGHAMGKITIWDIKNQPTRPIFVLQDQQRGVFALQYSQDGKRLFSGGRDGKVRIWDAQGYSQLAAISGHEDFVFSLALSPDGQRLISGSGDGTIRIWETHSRSHRMQTIRSSNQCRPKAKELVRKLFENEGDAGKVYALVKNDDSLDETMRRECFNAILGIKN